MAGLSTYLANKLNDHARGVASYSMPTVYAGLTTTSSSASAAGTEAAYTGYARVALSGLLGTSTGGSGVNSAAITFPTCTGGTSTVVGWATFDAPTGGNLLEFGTCSLSVSTNIQPQFAASQFTSSFS